jgi:hypothetical protein
VTGERRREAQRGLVSPRPGSSIKLRRASTPPRAGATAVFRSNPFERRFRDMHAIAQQIQARDTHYEDVGKMILSGDR